jgi:hypothetical protein
VPDEVTTNEITERFLTKVAQNREEARKKFGDDYRAGKQPLFLWACATEQCGRVAEAVAGNASNDVVLNAGLAQDRLITLAATCASLYELIEKCGDLNHLRRALDE